MIIIFIIFQYNIHFLFNFEFITFYQYVQISEFCFNTHTHNIYKLLVYL